MFDVCAKVEAVRELVSAFDGVVSYGFDVDGSGFAGEEWGDGYHGAGDKGGG